MKDLFFAKTNPNAIIPSKNDEDAGYDFYACFEEEELVINPGEIKLIPTGIATAFDKDFVLVLKERSSSGVVGLAARAGIIDSGYRGEIFFAINNTTNKKITISKKVSATEKLEKETIYPYIKGIGQGLYIKLADQIVKEISYEELKNMKSVRGEGTLGSSGK